MLEERNLSLDILRGVAAFGIVGCHLALLPMTHAAWLARALCDMNVCLFAALAGYLMHGRCKNTSAAAYIHKRAVRLLPQYGLWSCFYVALSVCFALWTGQGVLSKYSSSSYLLSVIFLGSSSTHLWFLISLFYGQTVFKVLLTYLRLPPWGALVGGFVLIIGCSLTSDWVFFYPLRLLSALMAGYGVRAYVRRCALSPVISWILLLSGVATHYLLNSSVPVFVRDWCLALIVLGVVSGWEVQPRWIRLSHVLGETSMGVFLLHPIFAAACGLVLRRFCKSPFGVGLLLCDWVLVWMLAFGTSFLLRRTVFGRALLK